MLIPKNLQVNCTDGKREKSNQIGVDRLCCIKSENKNSIVKNPTIQNNPLPYSLQKAKSITQTNPNPIHCGIPTWNDIPSSGPQTEAPYPQKVEKNCFISTKCPLKS